jgi:hypothetical protein
MVSFEEKGMNTVEQFEQAKQIATTAILLDSDKNNFPEDARVLAAMCVENLHVLAEKLAGSQAGKIYS